MSAAEQLPSVGSNHSDFYQFSHSCGTTRRTFRWKPLPASDSNKISSFKQNFGLNVSRKTIRMTLPYGRQTLGTVRMVKRAVLYPQWPGRTTLCCCTGECSFNDGGGNKHGCWSNRPRDPTLSRARPQQAPRTDARSANLAHEERRRRRGERCQDIGTPSGCATKREMRGRTEGRYPFRGICLDSPF